MTKKTFDINQLFNVRRFDKCLEDVLEVIVAEEELDQQDIIDIIETASRNYRNLYNYYIRRKDSFLAQANAPRGGFGTPFSQSYGPSYPVPNGFSDRSRQLEAERQVISCDEHPEFFELLFNLSEFEIAYNTTPLTDTFKFLGVDIGKGLTYLGRDKELVTVAGTAQFFHGQLVVRLECQEQFGQIHLAPTQASRVRLEQAIYKGDLTLPGQKAINPATRELMEHMRTQAWLQLKEGDLATRVDAFEEPAQVYLVGRIEHYHESLGTTSEACVMPVQIHDTGIDLMAKPMGNGIHKVDLMLLKPYVHKG